MTVLTAIVRSADREPANFPCPQVGACNRRNPLLELCQPSASPLIVGACRPGGREAWPFSLSVPSNSTGAETMLYDLPWWVMILMLLAVIGLIVLLIYLRKKDREG
jgi:hypothetical protein